MSKSPRTTKTSAKEEPGTTTRTGDTTLADIETGIARLEEFQAELKAFAAWMEQAKEERLTIDGPGLLSRGVNSILQYTTKVEAAIKAKRRMR